jgi:hypothetical protein
MFLIHVANELGMDTEGTGELAVNQNSGNTYLWLEDYNFTLYMPISCDLKKDDIYCLWTNSEDGTEEEISLGNKTLREVQDWSDNLDKLSRRDD